MHWQVTDSSQGERRTSDAAIVSALGASGCRCPSVHHQLHSSLRVSEWDLFDADATLPSLNLVASTTRSAGNSGSDDGGGGCGGDGSARRYLQLLFHTW